MDTAHVGILRQALAPLCEPLHVAIAAASEAALAYFSEHHMTDPSFRTCQSHLARAHLAAELKDRGKTGSLGKWRTVLGQNSQITLESGSMHLRLLRPLQGLTAPPAGTNGARRAYYSQRLSQMSLLGVEGSDLLGIWAYDPEALEASIRIVRPLRPWHIRSGEQIDLDLLLPTSSQALTKMRFVPTDDELPALPLVEEEDDVDDGIGG